MSTILSKKIVTDATAEVDNYTSSVRNLLAELDTAITGLIGSGFIGEAADGYKTFFTTKIVPALSDNLTEGDSSLMGAIKKMMEDIGTQLVDTVDPAIGKANAGAGQSGT